MEWEKAKTILIVIFLLLNAGLFAMGRGLARSYRMSPEEISAIGGILNNNGITLGCELPLESRPLRFMNVAAAEWDHDFVRTAFFPEQTDITMTYEQGGVIYASPETGASVVVTDVYSGVPSRLIYTEPVASRGIDAYLGLLGERFEGFRLVRVFDDGLSETYLYCESYKNDPIFSSCVSVCLTDDGSAAVVIDKYDFVSFLEGEHQIFRPDEALLTFIHYKNEHFEHGVVIESFELGYVADAAETGKNRKARPFYRIFMEGVAEPVLIDAVMNTVLYDDAAPEA